MNHWSILISSLLITYGLAVELPLEANSQVCAVIMSSFEPINIDISFPTIPDQLEGDIFKVFIKSFETSEIVFEQSITPGKKLRTSLTIEPNIIHELCIHIETERFFPQNTMLYIPFTQSEDFSKLIGQIDIPEQLAKDKNLKEMYVAAKRISRMNEIVAGHQKKERQLEDVISMKSLHQTQKTVLISVIECAIIIFSGIYQLYALRRFLIDKNIY